MLQPTLWRTCRALANRDRLRLMQALLRKPAGSVEEVAEATGIAEPRASAYLRALHARGLLAVRRAGRFVHYRPAADPRVPGAGPLIEALRAPLRKGPRGVEFCFRQLTAFTHARRVAVVRALGDGALATSALARRTAISRRALARHLAKLEARRFVARDPGGRVWNRTPGVAFARTLQALARASDDRW